MRYEEIQKFNACLTQAYTTKAQLYKKIEAVRNFLHISLEDYPINFWEVLDHLRGLVDYTEEPFNSKTICGMLVRKDLHKTSHIYVNQKLSPLDKYFAMNHEMVHFFCHGQEHKFMCSPLTKLPNDRYEWQANEGAAELLLPYQNFLIDYKIGMEVYKDHEKTIQSTAQAYGVSPTVAQYRYNNLCYELQQYLEGTPLNKVKILSKKQLERMNIIPKLKPLDN